MRRPEESILRAAGIMPPPREMNPLLEEINELLSLLQTITADRDDKTILAEIHYYYPPPELKKNADIKTVPMGHAPVGALVYRHSFMLSLRSKRNP